MELILFIGLQASGKSTFFHKHFAATHELVSKDLMRNNKNRTRRQTQLVEAALQAGHSLVVDNTNPTVEDRASLIEIGKLYGAQILGYYFESKVSDCLERNQQRSGKARVPDVAMYATIKKLVRPTYTEGFHQLFYVRIAGNCDFKVHAWMEGESTDGA
ncbi:MAG: ATP-binding protein [Coleofasciculus sp. Co-bin14]|nr:ATP-binding protein [Coleofasciculus sp. Co-bin14]